MTKLSRTYKRRWRWYTGKLNSQRLLIIQLKEMKCQKILSRSLEIYFNHQKCFILWTLSKLVFMIHILRNKWIRSLPYLKTLMIMCMAEAWQVLFIRHFYNTFHRAWCCLSSWEHALKLMMVRSCGTRSWIWLGLKVNPNF